MNAIETTLRELTRIARREWNNPKIRKWASALTRDTADRRDKMRVLLEDVRGRLRLGEPTTTEGVGTDPGLLLEEGVRDAEEASLLLAAGAMSVGIQCRFVAARYGESWTCWVAAEVDGQLEFLDPTFQRPARGEPDEVIFGKYERGLP